MKVEKLEEDLCRCCHSEGKFKSIAADTEDVVYCDMLRECYGIELVALSEPLYRILCAICDTCILRLQDAAEFKRQVQECEKVFRDLYLQADEGNNKEKMVVYSYTEVKSEADIDPSVVNRSANDDDIGASDHGDHEDNKLDVEEAYTPHVKEESEHDDFGMSGDHGDDEGVRVKEEENYIPQVQEKTENKPIQVSILNVKMNRRVVRLRRKVAPPKDKNIVDTVQEKYIRLKKESKPQRTYSNTKRKQTKTASSASLNGTWRPQSNADFAISTYGSRGKEMSEVVTPMNNVAPTIHEEIVTTVEVIKEPPPSKPKVTLRRDVDFQWSNTRFQCCKCDYKCKQIGVMSIHVKKKHNMLGSFNCSFCNKTFPTNATFQKHKLDKHSVDNSFKCLACDKTFKLKRSLELHKKRYHLLGDKLKCELCDYECFHKTYIKMHMVKHGNEKNFHCKYCQKSFKRRSSLLFHERIHTGDKRKVCKECGQAFVQKASLNYHMNKYHPGVKF